MPTGSRPPPPKRPRRVTPGISTYPTKDMQAEIEWMLAKRFEPGLHNDVHVTFQSRPSGLNIFVNINHRTHGQIVLHDDIPRGTLTHSVFNSILTSWEHHLITIAKMTEQEYKSLPEW